MDQSLKEWIDQACSEVLQIQESSTYSLESKVKLVANHVMEDTLDSINEIQVAVSKALGVCDTEYDLMYTAKLVLKYAVSGGSVDRDSFVSHIISMSPSVQEHLMQAIQEVHTEEIDPEPRNMMEEDEPNIEHAKRGADLPGDSDVGVCDMCVKKDIALENYRHEISYFVEREKKLEEQIKTESTSHLGKLMDVEAIVNEKIAEIKHLNGEISLLKKKETEYLCELKEKSALENKVSGLQDEIDVLTPLAKRTEVAEKQLDRLRERMDRLDGVNDQLKAESAAHSETHSKLVLLEKELDSLRKVKSNLEEYRTKNAENVITIADLTAQLERGQEMVTSLTQRLAELTEGSHSSEQRAKLLTEELMSASEQLKNVERGVGVGAGISEFNPEVKKELLFLRNENADLKQKLNYTSLDHLDKLQQDISDQQCVNASLQMKWAEAKDVIQEKTDEIASLKASLCEVRQACAQLRQERAETSIMAEQDRAAMMLSYKSRIKHLQQLNCCAIQLTCIGKSSIIQEVSNDLESTESNLSASKLSLEAMTETKEQLEVTLSKTENNLKEVSETAQKTTESLKRKLCDMEEAHKQELSSCIDSGKRMIAEIKAQHSQEIDIERSKSSALEADIEDERVKRRRVEREKRFHESEAQKYKSQMQVAASTTGNNIEVESAIKELKLMQEQLDSSRADVKRLQEQLALRDGEDILPLPSQQSDADMKTASSTSINDSLEGHGMAGHPKRAMRLPAASREVQSSTTAPKSSGLTAYIEQTELLERRIQQMTRERREMIAKNLEENKERMEISQKLLQSEREYSILKSKLTKITLEKERLERRIAKHDTENIAPRSPEVVTANLL